MSIPETIHFDNTGEVVKNPGLRRWFPVLVVVLVAILAFGLGRLSAVGQRAGVTIEYSGVEKQPAASGPESTLNQASAISASPRDGTSLEVTASSKGTKYYFSHCRNTISAANKITFSTPSEAERAGYTLAATCKPK